MKTSIERVCYGTKERSEKSRICRTCIYFEGCLKQYEINRIKHRKQLFKRLKKKMEKEKHKQKR